LKKGFAYFFLVIFMFNFMGNYLVFEVNKIQVKKEMQAFIRTRRLNSHLVTFKIFHPENNPDLRRIEKREIIYKGLLYDIVIEKKQGDSTLFSCIRDHKEEILIAGYKKVQNRKITLALLHNLITQALPVDMIRKAERPFTEVFFQDKINRVDPGHLFLFAPPPECS
jgi:hypothetical protein